MINSIKSISELPEDEKNAIEEQLYSGQNPQDSYEHEIDDQVEFVRASDTQGYDGHFLKVRPEDQIDYSQYIGRMDWSLGVWVYQKKK